MSELKRFKPRPDRLKPPPRTHRKPRTIPWPWDDRGRSALVAEATIDSAPAELVHAAREARLLYERAMMA